MDKLEMNQEQKNEQNRVNHVVKKINQAQARLSNSITSVKSDEKEINKNFFTDVKVNVSSYGDLIDTAMSIRQQQQMLMERENNWRSSENQIQVLNKLERTPYFARIDLKEDETLPSETIYIGLGSFTDEQGNFLIYDWRAPISSVYYDGGVGEVSYMTPDGQQAVDVTLKRQFIIENGQIKTMFDTSETIGDQMLLEVLGNQADTHMKSIVTTIQHEQNRIIRNTTSKLLFVQGAAGSGKTSAVLQRIAYLLYRYRGKLTSAQVVMFSPNQLFNDYIADVLPELGEQNMVQFTYNQYLQRRLPRLKIAGLFEQFEAQASITMTRANQLKESRAYFDALNAYAKQLERKGVIFKDIAFRDQIMFSKKQIADIYYQFNENYHLGNRLTATKEVLLAKVTRKINKEAKKTWVEEAVENLSPAEIKKLYGDQKKIESSEKEYRFLSRKIAEQAFIPVQRAIMRQTFLNLHAQYRHFLKQAAKWLPLEDFQLDSNQWQEILQAYVTELKNKRMSINDASPFLYLADLMTGRRGERHIRYVFIDEIQDYTPFQLAYLQFRFPNARFTMLGDLNQTIFHLQNGKNNLLDTALDLFGTQESEVIKLTKSYRSTKEITEFTKALLVGGEEIEAFNRRGPLPQVIVKKTALEANQSLLESVQKANHEYYPLAVITKNREDAEKIYTFLKENERVTLIQSENQRLAHGVIILPAYLAKGLEFDHVLIWQATDENYHTALERQILYTVSSRAMHTLEIISNGRITSFLENLDKNRYFVLKL